MVIRMKAFDTSKALENALSECGYRRPNSERFEEYLESLIEHEDAILPKHLLRQFHKLYISALFDPLVNEIQHIFKFDLNFKSNVIFLSKPFTIEKLRDLNRTINKIIAQ